MNIKKSISFFGCIISIILLSSCERNMKELSKVIEGTYYQEYKLEGKRVFGFIEIKDGKYINNHGLYYDMEQESIYREPYNPDIYKYEIKGNTLIVIDHTGSYEVEKLSLFKTETISKNPTYKIIVNKRKGNVTLKNVDVDLVHKKVIK